MLVGSTPYSRCSIVVLPATTMHASWSGSDRRLLQGFCPAAETSVPRTIAFCMRPTMRGSCMQRLMRVNTLSPSRVWAFSAEALPTTRPVASSTTITTTVVVPMSTATP